MERSASKDIVSVYPEIVAGGVAQYTDRSTEKVPRRRRTRRGIEICCIYPEESFPEVVEDEG